MPSSSSLVSTSRRITEGENNENPTFTGMNLGLQQLKERIIATTTSSTTTCNTTQLRVRSIIDIVGCDITIEDIQSAKHELLNKGVDLKMDVNTRQKLRRDGYEWGVTPLIHFCSSGNLLIVRLLFLIGANCTGTCTTTADIYWFPMIAAAHYSHFDICKWLFKYGGDAKYQINKETSFGDTPLQAAYAAWRSGRDKEGLTSRWLLRNGGGQHYSSKAMNVFIGVVGPRKSREEKIKSNLLIMWMRENIQLHGTFILFLCGTTTMITSSSSSSSEPNAGGTGKRNQKQTRQRKRHRERSLQILDSHPRIMELIGNYVGVIREKEFQMLQEFNELVIEYKSAYQSSSDDGDDDDDDDDDESTSDVESTSDDENDNGEEEDEE